MEYYSVIKTIHISCAIVSLAGFMLRGWWMINGNNNLLKAPLAGILPHINDSILLIAAIYLSLASQRYPLVEGWLTAKLLLLIGYIVTGIFALKHGKTKKTRTNFLFIALFCIAAIFTLAIFKPVFTI